MSTIVSSLKKDFRGREHHLLVIGGGVLQYPTLEVCYGERLGMALVDEDVNCYCARNNNFLPFYLIQASIREPEEVLKGVKEFLRKHRAVKLVGVYTQGTDAEYTVAYVAKNLGLPNIGIETAFKCNNKIAMRETFWGAVIPQPEFEVGELENLKPPVVVKAVDNCASRGVTIVRKKKDLKEAIGNALKYSRDKRVLFEEFIQGEEYSVDTIVYKGKVYPAGISDRTFEKKDNYAVQGGSLTPSLLPTDYQEQMYSLMQECANALGVKWGALKGDLIIDRWGDIKVLEVTARLSGGFDSQYRKPYSFGVNLIKATIDLACGKPLDFEDIIPKWNKVSQTFTIFPEPGLIKKIVGLDKVLKIPGIKNVFLTKEVGDCVLDYRTCADRVVHIVACRDTYKELYETVQRAKRTLKFITT